MSSLLPLIRNETLKIWRKKRFAVILLLLTVLIPIFTYAQVKMSESFKQQTGTDDWRIKAEAQINEYKARTESTRIPEEWKKWFRVEIERLQIHLDRNIDPNSASGVTFAREFAVNAVSLFLPLMVMVISSDLVSSEHSLGTIKLLLTRPVRRWKVLAGKYVAMTFYVSFIVMATFALSYLISGAFLGYSGWRSPVLTGFAVVGSTVDATHVRIVEQWQFLWMVLGLAWFSCMVVACLSLMVSVLVRSTAAGMGIMLAVLISGTILSNMAGSWEAAKYFFMVNLDTVTYLAGQAPPIPGMTLPFSLAVLAVTAWLSIVVSFGVFTRRDVLN
ncbi:ABC transporter permease [Paenibacillus thermotolerans]|uniref:ABC transporter permease n=1 Tax=Paenibacillus thermotolerans TaxID=3027807 RepID=UPI0023687BD7|nr:MULTISPECIES: ABC transporter permease [unclassified Paenibacillus]